MNSIRRKTNAATKTGGAGGGVLFSSDDEYNSFVAEFLADKRISFITTY